MSKVEPYQHVKGTEYTVLQHILYEIDMFIFRFDSHDRLSDEIKQFGEPERLSNAVLESQLLHARSLLDFFTATECTGPKNSHPDVLLKNFDGMPEQLVREDTSSLKERLDRALAHITYDRIKYMQSKASWQPEAFRPILMGCLSFLNRLNPDKCSEEDRVEIGVLKDKIERLRLELLPSATTNAPVHAWVSQPD